MGNAEPGKRTVDLTLESLELAVCSVCAALVLQEYFPLHADWHVKGTGR